MQISFQTNPSADPPLDMTENGIAKSIRQSLPGIELSVTKVNDTFIYCFSNLQKKEESPSELLRLVKKIAPEVVVVDWNLNDEAFMNQISSDGANLLLWAALNGYADVMKLLIERGDDVNRVHVLGLTALIYAAVNGHTDVVKLLLENGAEVNHGTKAGMTALMLAAERGRAEVVTILIAWGADVNQKNGDGLTALSLAERMNQGAVAAFLRMHATPPKPKESRACTLY